MNLGLKRIFFCKLHYVPTEAQSNFHFSEKKNSVFIGVLGAGKSTAGIVEMAFDISQRDNANTTGRGLILASCRGVVQREIKGLKSMTQCDVKERADYILIDDVYKIYTSLSTTKVPIDAGVYDFLYMPEAGQLPESLLMEMIKDKHRFSRIFITTSDSESMRNLYEAINYQQDGLMLSEWNISRAFLPAFHRGVLQAAAEVDTNASCECAEIDCKIDCSMDESDVVNKDVKLGFTTKAKEGEVYCREKGLFEIFSYWMLDVILDRKRKAETLAEDFCKVRGMDKKQLEDELAFCRTGELTYTTYLMGYMKDFNNQDALFEAYKQDFGCWNYFNPSCTDARVKFKSLIKDTASKRGECVADFIRDCIIAIHAQDRICKIRIME